MTCKALSNIESIRKGRDDDVFICSSNVEERCLGSIKRLNKKYRFYDAFIFNDGNDPSQMTNLEELERQLGFVGTATRIQSSEDDPRRGIARLRLHLRQLKLSPDRNGITIDVTGFSTKHTLLLLQTIDDLELWNCTRIIYTQPQDYISNSIGQSSGIRNIEVVPGFVRNQSLGKPVLLLIFLGYEGDRAASLVHNIDPNETLLAIPSPPFKKGWENRTRECNRNLIRLVGSDRELALHSIDSEVVKNTLERVLLLGKDNQLLTKNCCLVPLGTKPQTVGLYFFWRENFGKFEIVYAPPIDFNTALKGVGVGDTWELKRI